METIYIKDGSPERIFHKEEFYKVVGEYMGEQAEEFMRKNSPTCEEVKAEVNDLAYALCDIHAHASDVLTNAPEDEVYSIPHIEEIEKICNKFDYDSLFYEDDVEE